MKKSELRNIIRESIRSILKEQTYPPNVRDMHMGPCEGSSGAHVPRRGTVDGNVPQVGDVITMTPGNGAMYVIYSVDMPGQSINGNHWIFNQIHNFPTYSGPDCCSSACGTQASGTGNMFNFHVLQQAGVSGPGAMNGNCATNTGNYCCSNSNYSSITPLCSSYPPPPPPPPTSGCDPSAPFPPNFNLSSWTNTWTSLPNFSSSNPNQPCNFICQRRNQWTSQLAAGGMGPKQTNMVACRLEEAENQYQIHNCATSNANNCP